MLKFTPKLCTIAGETITKHVRIIEESEGNVKAVYADALSRDAPIDPDCGMLIDIISDKPVRRLMANYRYSEFWCRPFFGEKLTDIPDETQALILELESGEFVSVVPVVNDTYKCVLKGTDTGFAARVFSWYDKLYTCKGLCFVYSIGSDPVKLTEECVKTALKILDSGVRHRTERRYPERFEYLGWCSWDSMQIRVLEEGIIEKCEEFKEKNIPINWAILDDMWAEIHDFYGNNYSDFREMVSLMHSSAMYDFEADPIRFPNGLKHCIEEVNKYGINVGMWHPTTGYWRGIEPESKAYDKLREYLIETPDGKLVGNWKSDKSYMYFKTFHDFFRRCGADFVKIDNQTMTRRFYKGLAPVGKIAREYHDGMEASVGEHFDNCMINCMGMGSEDMFSRSVSPVSRCSNDFLPENREWFTNHVLQCAYNSILQGQFYWCDWDMWWTDDSQAVKNSLMRAISGGPIYVSDKIGRSRGEILKPLALSDGRILRCDKPCTPTADCVTEDPTVSGKALKLENTAGEYGILALLNLDSENKPVEGRIINEVFEECAIYEHFSHELKMLRRGDSFDVILSDNDDFRLYILAPVKDGFAAIGRTDKFISPLTIEYVCGEKIKLIEDGPYAYIKDGILYEYTNRRKKR